MKKTVVGFVLGFLAVVTLFISAPTNSVHANEVEPDITIQQESKIVTITVNFPTTFPPSRYYYNDGYFQGYIARISNGSYSNGVRWGIYAGTVYRQGAPIESFMIEKME